MLEKVRESDVSRAIIEGFTKDLLDHTSTDVVIVGSGPAGLTAAYYLSKEGIRTLIIERNIYAGGGFWQGGFLFPKTVVQSPGNEIIEELGVEMEEVKPGLYMADSFRIVSKLLSKTAEAGAKLLNSTYVDDVIYKDGRISGVVVNWFPITQMPKFITCMDPIALEAKVVIDATGHDAAISTRAREILGLESIDPGERRHGAMNVSEAEEAVVEHTGEIIPGLVICGMAVATIYRTPRMGPIFGGMLLSGRKAAETASAIVRKKVPVE
ncbi:MAG: thiazole biosynthesis protein [Methanobacteriota archaeon]|nr:MAG: thiazole biosynthesis protein [Euryarchaeota archaeon]